MDKSNLKGFFVTEKELGVDWMAKGDPDEKVRLAVSSNTENGLSG